MTGSPNSPSSISGVADDGEHDFDAYLRPSTFVDSDHPSIVLFRDEVLRAAGATNGTEVERIVALFLAVRDGVRYDPYRADLSLEGLKASTTLERRAAYCVPKAVLLAALARSTGIAARLVFVDVKNHLATPKLLELLGTNEFIWHGYTELFLGGRWVKATPTFDQGLCDRFGVKTLDFDGVNDAVFHPFDREGREHMQYLQTHGAFVDIPHERMVAAWRAKYPKLFGEVFAAPPTSSFADEAAEYAASTTR